MKNTTIKSIGAIVAGFSAASIISIITDIILSKTGFMKTEPFSDNPTWVIVIIIIYRTLYNILGCCLTARLAPNNPMRHVVIIGIIGFVLGIVGTIAMWDKPPHWYPMALVLLAIPSAWIGGKLESKLNYKINKK